MVTSLKVSVRLSITSPISVVLGSTTVTVFLPAIFSISQGPSRQNSHRMSSKGLQRGCSE